MIRGAGGGVHVRRHNRRKPAHSIPQAVLMHRLEVSGATVCLGEGGGHVCGVQSAAAGEIQALTVLGNMLSKHVWREDAKMLGPGSPLNWVS